MLLLPLMLLHNRDASDKIFMSASHIRCPLKAVTASNSGSLLRAESEMIGESTILVAWILCERHSPDIKRAAAVHRDRLNWRMFKIRSR